MVHPCKLPCTTSTSSGSECNFVKKKRGLKTVVIQTGKILQYLLNVLTILLLIANNLYIYLLQLIPEDMVCGMVSSKNEIVIFTKTPIGSRKGM